MFPFRFLPLFLLVFAPFFLSKAGYAAAPSGQEWFTLKTPNFRVHHTAPLENYARRVSVSLEKALPILEKKLFWKAPVPIDVILQDPSDSANGLAMNFPSTRIELFSTPFESDSSLAHYDDWVNELAIHELTHIIANDTTLGGYRFLRSIFGSWVKPNGLQPLWMVEGLAVYMETSLTTAGRGRSPLTYALIHEALKKGALSEVYPMHRMNDGNGWWPGGNTPYVLGYLLQAATVNATQEAPGRLSERNASKIPFQPNSLAEDVLGKDWFAVWSEASNQLQAKWKKESPSTICQLTASGKFTGGHSVSQNGWVYFSEEDFQTGTHLARIAVDAPCNENQVERLVRKPYGGPNQVAVSDDGKTVVFAQYDSSSFERFYSDLHEYELETESVRQLTFNERARDPAIYQNKVYYLKQNPDLSSSIVEWDTNQPKVLFTAKPMERLSGLSASKFGLHFSRHNNQGQEAIWVLPFGSNEPKPLTEMKSALNQWDRNPIALEDGTLVFSRSFSNADNSSARQKIMKLEQGKLLEFSLPGFSYLDRPVPLKSGEFLLALATENGQNLVRAKLEPSQDKEPKDKASANPDLHFFLTGESLADQHKPTEGDLQSVGEVLPYSQETVATSLWPQYWLPEFSAAEEGYLIGASTSGNDPLDYQRWAASAQYDSRAKFPVYRAYYQNRSLPTSLFFEINQRNNYFRSTNSSNKNTQYSASATIPIHPLSLTVGAAFQEKFLFGRKTQSGILYQSLNYQEVGKTPAAIDPNYGLFASWYSGLYPNSKGEKFFADLRPKLGAYFVGFLPSHSLSVQARAGITTNKLLASNYYLGGGASALNDSDFIVRGYPIDSLFGQKIITANFSYSLPLTHLYWGWSTNPLFVKNLGLRFHSDFGTANYTANYRENIFRFYQSTALGKKILAGFGLDFVANGSLFYHVPVSLVVGAHYGPQKFAGGGFLGYFGFNAGFFGGFGSGHEKESHSH